MLDWLTSPSDAFARKAEAACDIGLFVCTLLLTVGVIFEYLGEHFGGSWWARKARWWMILVLISLAGEVITETGSFIYSYDLQSSEAASQHSGLIVSAIIPENPLIVTKSATIIVQVSACVRLT